MKHVKFYPLLLTLICAAPIAHAGQMDIEFDLPKIADSKYQRPYVAVWVEGKSQKKAVKTLLKWHEDEQWLKDIRRWWRKVGRYGDEHLDAVTSATKAPGQYKLQWDLRDDQGQPLPAGDYTLLLESVREHGNRSLLKQKFSLPVMDKTQQFTLPAAKEIGPVTIKIGEK